MRAMLRALVIAVILGLALPVMGAFPAQAVQPDEILDDPSLEARARALSANLRCVVCQNESIDESNADLARDMRLVVRERLVAGDSDEAVMQFMVDRYGEFVLLSPRRDGVNIILWASGPILLLLGLGFAIAAIRRRGADAPEPLSEEERARLKEIMRE
ncbi:MAG: cytochrome c-type biogenesis protein CcmH [Pararhodobacter sp.]|nr:cytochrome c-type biogenesis protein CcmH [Pararhodobacter sp.]